MAFNGLIFRTLRLKQIETPLLARLRIVKFSSVKWHGYLLFPIPFLSILRVVHPKCSISVTPPSNDDSSKLSHSIVRVIRVLIRLVPAFNSSFKNPPYTHTYTHTHYSSLHINRSFLEVWDTLKHFLPQRNSIVNNYCRNL